MWCVHARVQTTGVGGEHMSEWVREWESEFTCFVWLCYCFYRVLLAWWFCSFQLHCISLYFARFCTHVKCVCVFFRFLHTFFSLSLDRTTIWTAFVCIAFRRCSVNAYNFCNVLWLSRFRLSILQKNIIPSFDSRHTTIIWWIRCFIWLFEHFDSAGFCLWRSVHLNSVSIQRMMRTELHSWRNPYEYLLCFVAILWAGNIFFC